MNAYFEWRLAVEQYQIMFMFLLLIFCLGMFAILSIYDFLKKKLRNRLSLNVGYSSVPNDYYHENYFRLKCENVPIHLVLLKRTEKDHTHWSYYKPYDQATFFERLCANLYTKL